MAFFLIHGVWVYSHCGFLGGGRGVRIELHKSRDVFFMYMWVSVCVCACVCRGVGGTGCLRGFQVINSEKLNHSEVLAGSEGCFKMNSPKFGLC